MIIARKRPEPPPATAAGSFGHQGRIRSNHAVFVIQRLKVAERSTRAGKGSTCVAVFRGYRSPAETCVEGLDRTRRSFRQKVRPPDSGQPVGGLSGQPPLVVTTHAITSSRKRLPGPAGDQPRVSLGPPVRRTTLRTTRSRPGTSRVSPGRQFHYTPNARAINLSARSIAGFRVLAENLPAHGGK